MDPAVHILVADDNENLREYMARVLRRWWRVETVSNGDAALELIRRQPPALVLADAAMPGLDGAALPEVLRRDPVTRPIPLLVLADGEAGVEHLDAKERLLKPFSSRELIASVAARLQRSFQRPVRTERSLQRLLNTIDVPVAVFHCDDCIVENANRAYLDLADGASVIGKPFGESFPDAARIARDACERVRASKAKYVARDLILPQPRKGEIADTHWDFVFAPVHDDGQGWSRHIVAIGVEVTGAIHARQQREALAAQAISANHAKDQFLATLGHELRNPLAPILAGLQLMRVKGHGTHELDVVERQVGVLARLAEDLLDVSRIGRGQVELRKELVEVADLIARAIETVDPLLKERGHCLALHVPGAGLRVDVDPSRMTQVFANLLTNAAKYCETGSEITVRAERDGVSVRVSIADRGIGIAPEMLPHVFEPFAQEQTAVSRSRGGLGLGLAIVRNLVEAHGGRVWVHSDGPNLGSTFAVELPAR